MMFAKTITPIVHNLNVMLLKNINSKYLYCSLKTYSTFNSAQNVFSLYGSSLVHHQIINSNSLRSFNFIQFDHNTVLVRHFAKSKDKGKEKKKGTKPKVVLTDEEMSDVVPIYELKEEINKIIEKLKSDCAVNLSIRSNNSAIDNLQVDFEGNKYPLNEIAQISRKNPNLVVLNMTSTPEAIKSVLEAISASGMNINPQQEATMIYLPIPKVTREHREILAKNAKVLLNNAKDELNHAYASFSNYAKKQKKAGISEELIFNTCENLKVLIDKKVAECEAICNTKVNELLGDS